MNHHATGALARLLLTSRGMVYVNSAPLSVSPALEEPASSAAQVRAVELELAHLGFVASERLRRRLLGLPLGALAAFRRWTVATLATRSGADRKHEPLFRKFPRGVPDDTTDLWWTKVLAHYLQAPEQPCLFCARRGTTHVLRPCEHVVCDHCFDGANYSACPVCEHHVDRDSPFFQPSPERPLPEERVRFRLLDLGEYLDADARALFHRLCARTQALSEADREALKIVVRERPEQVMSWLPEAIPVRENVALIFGTLFGELSDGEVLSAAGRFMTSATDVLRFIAVLSGTDGSLQAETVIRRIQQPLPGQPFWRKVATMLGSRPPPPQRQEIHLPTKIYRFKVARLKRSLRRALLAILDGLHPERLVEDMLRHRSYWIWVGEFLHPHEYARRFPRVADAFKVLRKQAPDGTRAAPFRGWHSRLEMNLAAADTTAVLEQLGERPGELARRYDQLLRVAGEDDDAIAATVQAFEGRLSRYATPLLMTLRHHLPLRTAPVARRIFWPKGKFARGVSAPDTRAPLPARVIESSTAAIDGELLRRFEALPAFPVGVLDTELRSVIVPFNERTASVSALVLPRGSKVAVEPSKTARLFLHWCEPDRRRCTTDLDLSVALYDGAWKYVGVCSYYQLEFPRRGTDGTRKAGDGTTVARSAGDLQSAPPPDGASEFVDLDLAAARKAGIRYAVMVVNSYAGLPFSRLDRAFAGLMLRDDIEGSHFDPRTVELKFELDGENGVFLPLVFDLEDWLLHWLDVHSQGQFAMNNVETSRSDIGKLCPESIAYFESGARPSMFDLGLLHLAARCRRVILRGGLRQGMDGGRPARQLTRRPDESAAAFHHRLRRGDADLEDDGFDPGPEPVLALLHRGDVELPPKSRVYALFRQQLTPDLAASDLL